jgi:probable O-glycosylation ligase (exosortase A-associated)
MRDILLTAIFFGVLPFVFSRPYVGIYIWSWMGFMNPHRLTYGFAYEFPFAQIIAIVILVSMLRLKEPVRVPWTRETILLLVFILWMFFTTFFAFNSDGAWEQWDKVWKIQLMLFVTLMLIDTKQKLDWLIWVIVLSLGLYGVKGGIFTIMTGGSFRVMGPAGSFIGGNNEIALALIMTIPLMRYLQLQAKKVWIHQGVTVAMLLTGVAVIGTQSRGALVGMAVMGTFLWLKSRNRLFTLLSILVVVGALAAIMPQEWYDRMATIETFEEDRSALTRINAWWMAFNIAASRITGGGFETFYPWAIRQFAPDPTMGADARRLTRHRSETKWAADLASMIQVSMVGYAASGAFLGLAYFDLYYTLVAIMVICKLTSFAELERLDVVPGMSRKDAFETDARPRHEAAVFIKNE